MWKPHGLNNMKYDNLINKQCVFIEYESKECNGRIVMLQEFYDKVHKKLMSKLKKCTITLFEQKQFTYHDIDFVKKGRNKRECE